MSYFVPSLKPTASSQRASLQHCCNFPPTQDPLSRTRHAHHLECVKSNDSLIYFILCALKDWSISFQGLALHSLLHFRSLLDPDKVYPQDPTVIHSYQSFVWRVISRPCKPIGQYVTCQNQACLFEVIKVIDLIIDDVSRFSMFHVFTIFKAESISYRLYVSISRFTW